MTTLTWGGYCYIYFSGNGIYDPDTFEVFHNTIVEKDRYEWQKWKACSSREIFIRDVNKSWYFNGINNKCANIRSVVDLLKTLTQGYKVITVGSSAGGYAAVLFGSLLKAHRIFAFSAQYDLTDWLSARNLLATESVSQQYEYVNIISLVKKSMVPIYYFYPAYAEKDIRQRELVKDISNIHTFGIKSKLHGKAVYPNSLPTLLQMDEKELKKLEFNYENKITSPFKMAIATTGIKVAMTGFFYNSLKPIYYKYKTLVRKLKV